ncbi:chemotaxis protein CheW [Sulfurimonas sp. SAG-AH-194-I05]|nr:chemotaxis protein CheW [Sulfurimonas sp. SAG-AH-194-I05]MDF1874211.1 chemotaxis protein CheW [Sulfurimonas sp. SAG-AH-194-I05]
MSVDESEVNIENNIGEEQYLFFLVAGVLYGIEALKAQEIVEYSSITKVPMIRSFVKGVTNIRGNIVPVIDLLERFELGKTKITGKTSIVVVNHAKEEGVMPIGIIIDEVYEVDSIDIAKLRKAPEFGSKIDPKFILHMGKYEQEYIAILNTKTILNIDALSQLEE